MNTTMNEITMKELNPNEMEQVNGGSIIGLLCVLGVVGGAIGMAIGIGHALKDSDVEIHNGPFH